MSTFWKLLGVTPVLMPASPRVPLRQLRRELHEIQGLMLAAQSTLSVDDYGENLAGAQERLTSLLARLDGEGVGA